MSSTYLNSSPFDKGALRPLRSRQLATMPCYVGANYTSDETCSLCLEEFSSVSIFRRLPCEHYFHQPCIDKWVCKRDASCPLCRKTFYDLCSTASVPTPTTAPSSDDDNATHMSRPAFVHFVHRWKGVFHLSSVSFRRYA
ncbi:uncharacterized protein N7487_010664 [Penicillium crustosum]|uniref:uncharacterized protein n=1 Tax=Penicillium crustosum TaxID=36656 RepID=UPI002398930C|nr:uncharacterized protein N7487_010664 [Penicillium crustosum]KAJ5396361.1 hypothetical protein N7487_010664 [Penicillium crustosum]